MKCAWDKLLAVLPPKMRPYVDQQGKDSLLELRIRKGQPVELVMIDGPKNLQWQGTEEDIRYVINLSSQYSPWSAETVKKGFITAQGGHRIGVCGEVITHNGEILGIRNPISLCVRIARDFQGLAMRGRHMRGNILIIGPPGSGKTTLLRDWIRQVSNIGPGSIAVVDERGELFPADACFDAGPRTDVLSGCSKPGGLEMVLKTMGPASIAVDEITSDEDCDALIQAGWCGVRVLATAHASSVSDLKGKQLYRKLLDTGLFDQVLVMNMDKSWRAERIC